jgi:outer membrane protein assembly factor BamD (BamD/ComL family)
MHCRPLSRLVSRVTLTGLLLAGFLPGCATQRAALPPAAQAPLELEMEPIKIEATHGPAGVQVASYDAQELFEQAGAALSQKRPDEALGLYARLLEAFPDSSYARSAHYNKGLAHQDKKDWSGAAAVFQAFVAKYASHADAKDAYFQLGATYAELENWPASAETFSRVLERTDLTADDRVEALARRAFAQFNLADLDTAERSFRSVLAFRDKVANEERLATDFYIAFTQYHLGQISHRRFRTVALRATEALMTRDMEEKARLLLESQRRYIDAIKVGHPGWASAAGFQVGSLYEELHDAFMAAPIPSELDQEGRTVYLDELRKKIRILLEKSLRWYRENLLMMERVGAASEWSEKSKVAYAKLVRLLDPAAKLDLPRPPTPAHESPPPPSTPDAPAPPPREAPPTPAAPSTPRQIL